MRLPVSSATHRRGLLLLLLAALPAAALAQSPPCRVDAECQDLSFCNGAERCAGPEVAGADARGCIAAQPATPCLSNQRCDEAADRCISPIVDQDGDGHQAASNLGDDCNDNDGNEFPGNQESWDAADHDEDCQLDTHGFTPGFGTVQRTGRFQVCSGEGMVVLQGTVGGTASFSEATCDNGTVCVPQPSGDGYCMARPDGYVAPPVLAGPRGDQPFQRERAAAEAPAAPPVAMPVVPRAVARPGIVLPAAPPVPALAAPACLAPRMRDKTGACVLPPGTCPDGMVFSEKVNACEKK